MYLVGADNDCPDHHTVMASLQGGRVTLASGSTKPEGQKIAQVYKQNFTLRYGNPTAWDNNVWLHSKDLDTIRKLAWEGRLHCLKCLQV